MEACWEKKHPERLDMVIHDNVCDQSTEMEHLSKEANHFPWITSMSNTHVLLVFWIYFDGFAAAEKNQEKSMNGYYSGH